MDLMVTWWTWRQMALNGTWSIQLTVAVRILTIQCSRRRIFESNQEEPIMTSNKTLLKIGRISCRIFYSFRNSKYNSKLLTSKFIDIENKLILTRMKCGRWTQTCILNQLVWEMVKKPIELMYLMMPSRIRLEWPEIWKFGAIMRIKSKGETGKDRFLK